MNLIHLLDQFVINDMCILGHLRIALWVRRVAKRVSSLVNGVEYLYRLSNWCQPIIRDKHFQY